MFEDERCFHTFAEELARVLDRAYVSFDKKWFMDYIEEGMWRGIEQDRIMGRWLDEQDEDAGDI